ncbi:hypothetical protein Mycsm_07214 (plasmid) [Mycobacterium sp. JS623]|uniref:bacterial transcriptional activator domain-containing protein n=1 Tax=Mycobacterium sp. JS623 TaxID=212767 RepID=UPI0002A557D6|nr:bacterial transcriptional activator domain-containing protein [Mycobacterium sp. JS623]AGB27308.1 hypothetical protein Mycsm_07214 [Mycobacterium sp. JS623]
MTSSTAVSSAPVTSWWYGQGRAVDVVRRLESLYTLNPAPAGPAGLVTVRRDELTVTFVTGLKSPLPHPWRAADSTANEVRIPWDVVDPGLEPDPERPVYLVAFGTTDEGALVALNLAAFQRIRVDGDPTVTTALISRWVLELLATHPDITIGVTPDVWRGPVTTRVQAVTVGHVPAVDVLVCGPDLTYTDRAQIVSNAASKIMIDLGRDAAVDAKWTITCGPDRLGQISRDSSSGGSRAMTATLILPTPAVVDRCADLLTDQPAPPPTPSYEPEVFPGDESFGDESFDPLDEPIAVDQFDEPDTAPRLPVPLPAAGSDPAATPDAAPGEPIDFFAAAASPALDDADGPPWSTDDAEPTAPPAAAVGAAPVWAEAAGPPAPTDPAVEDPQAAGDVPAPAAVVPTPAYSGAAPSGHGDSSPAPEVAPIWNRILGQVDLRPPHSTQQPGPREKRLNELTVFLQHNRFADSSDIVRAVYGGAASDKTVTQQLSLLRARLGVVHAGGPKALPPMRDGGYVLDKAVRSDWMEFERLVEILVDATATPHLIAAMDLVTGPPLGGVSTREWEWTKDLRDEIRDRVAGTAVVLARRHHAAKNFTAAVEIARKGLWYDNARQDLWQIGMQAALDGHDNDAFKTLRSQYLSAVPGPDRDPAVADLTKQAG